MDKVSSCVSGIYPECQEQLERVNKWEGGETRALMSLKKRVQVEEMVCVSIDWINKFTFWQ